MRDELLSIIITNYNYESYVGHSIESALAVDWPRVEIIVVDDGSTDESHEVINRYNARGIRAFFLANRGHAKAAAHGFAHSRGDWIIFLDSDDMLAPSIVRDAIKVMKPGWSMIQFQMEAIDALGRPLGRIFPKYPSKTNPASIRLWAASSGAYPAAPTSGNLLSRTFLSQILPFEEEMDRWIDSYFVPTAPFFGDVLTIKVPRVCYRVHGRNDGVQNTLDLTKIGRDLGRHIIRTRYAAGIARDRGIRIEPDCWRYGFYNLSMRVASLRLASAQHPIQYDTALKCIRDAAVSLGRPQGYSSLHRAAFALWIAGVAFGPKRFAHMLVSWRFAVSARPQVIERIIAAG